MAMLDVEAEKLSSQPIALYIDLVPGLKADLESVSQASISFVYALREAARILSPSLEIRVELQSGSESSLSLNSLIRAVSDKTGLDAKHIRLLLVTASLWFAGHEGTYVLDKGNDLVWDDIKAALRGASETTKHVSEQEAEQCFATLQKIQKSPNVQRHVRGIYRSLQHDTCY